MRLTRPGAEPTTAGATPKRAENSLTTRMQTRYGASGAVPTAPPGVCDELLLQPLYGGGEPLALAVHADERHRGGVPGDRSVDDDAGLDERVLLDAVVRQHGHAEALGDQELAHVRPIARDGDRRQVPVE